MFSFQLSFKSGAMEPVEKTTTLEKSAPADKKVKELTTNSC